MKRNAVSVTILVLVLSVLIPVSASAKEKGPFGIGIVLGSPTGLSMALRMNQVNTLQAGFAWNFVGDAGFVGIVDYLFHFDKLLVIDQITIPVYAGIGAKLDLPLIDDTIFGLGVRFPLGMRWVFEQLPLEIFLEISPGMRFIPGTSFDLGFALGGRWYL